MALDRTVMRTAARAGPITGRYHALLRAEERGMTRAQAIRVLTEGAIIEQRPRAKPFPTCLLMHAHAGRLPSSVRLRGLRCISGPSLCHYCPWARPAHVGRPMAKTEKKTMTTNINNQRCAVCGGERQVTTITHEELRDSHIYLFQNVPAKVCTACGEIWIDEEVLQQIDKLIEYGVPVRKEETPVYDFSRAAAPA